MRMSRQRAWIWAVVAACAAMVTLWLNQDATRGSAEQAEKVTIAALSLPGAGLFFVADNKGFFRDQGLDVALQEHAVGKLALESLQKGEAAYAIAGDTPLVFSILSGRKLDILSTVYRPNGGISIIALKARVPTPSDLRGKRLGVTFVSSGQFVADTFLLVHGIPQAEVTLLDMKQNEMVEALLTGKIDAASLWQPYLAEAETRLAGNGITFPNNGLYTFRLSLVATQGHAAQHPTQAQKILAALKKAQHYIVEQPADAMRIMSNATGIVATTFQAFFNSADYALGLEQGILLTFEDQTRWAIKHAFVRADKIPNYLEYIHTDALGAVSPESVKIKR